MQCTAKLRCVDLSTDTLTHINAYIYIYRDVCGCVYMHTYIHARRRWCPYILITIHICNKTFLSFTEEPSKPYAYCAHERRNLHVSACPSTNARLCIVRGTNARCAQVPIECMPVWVFQNLKLWKCERVQGTLDNLRVRNLLLQNLRVWSFESFKLSNFGR